MLHDLRTLLDVLRVAQVRMRHLVMSGVLAGFAEAAQLGVSWLLLRLVRAMVNPGSHHSFMLMVSAVYGMILIKNALDYASDVVLARESGNATQTLRRDLLARYLVVGKAFYDDRPSSKLRDTLVTASTVPATMVNNFHNLVTRTLSCVAVVGFLLFVSVKLTLFVLAVAPLANLVVIVVVRKMRASASRYIESRDRLVKTSAEILAGIVSVHAATAEAREAKRFEEASDHERDMTMRRGLLEQLVAPAKEIGATTTLLLVSAGIGMFDSGLAVADLFVFLFLVQRLMAPLSAIGDIRIRIARSSEDLERVNTLLHLDPKYLVPDGAQAFGGMTRGISIRNLTFRYADGAKPVIDDVSLDIPRGSKIALIGASGSGKTTLLNLLFRFYDTPPGTILVDDTDLRDLACLSWRKRIAYASQDNFLFDATLRENLCYGTERPLSDAELQRALERVQLTALLEKLPQGLDTLLGERGCRVSGGERQRIVLAQLLLRDAEIVLLDEVTSAVNMEMARKIVGELTEVLAGKTVVITSHRPELLDPLVDRVIVLDGGKIARVEDKRPEAKQTQQV
jgi:ATP-binding cassette, subfamily B, bacterial MsbA